MLRTSRSLLRLAVQQQQAAASCCSTAPAGASLAALRCAGTACSSGGTASAVHPLLCYAATSLRSSSNPAWMAQLGAARFLSSTPAPWQAATQQQQQPPSGGSPPGGGGGKSNTSGSTSGEPDSLELTDARMNAITDQIPQRPVGVVEAGSYTIIIAAAFAVLGFFIYNFVTHFLLEPVEHAAFEDALKRLQRDPRITVRLGNDVTGYGQESASRVARQQIPHAVYKDAAGVEHVRIQFHMRGPGGVALVNADMHQEADAAAAGGRRWEYTYLIVDVASGAAPAQRLNIIAPRG